MSEKTEKSENEKSESEELEESKNKYEQELASTGEDLDDTINALTKSGSTVFGVDTTSWDEGLEKGKTYIKSFDRSDTISDIKKTGSEALDGFEEAGDLLSNAFDDEQGWGDLGTAASSAALKYLNSLLEKYKNAWTQTEEVSVEEIIGEIAPYAVYTKNLPSIIGNKLVDMLTYIVTLGDTVSLGSILNEFLDTMLNDPSVASATSNLKVIQGVAKVFSSISKCIDTTKKILEVVEPYLPIIDIIVDMAMIMWSGGTSGTKAAQALSEYISNLCMELLSKGVAILKKMVFGIKFKMPVLLTGALNTLKLTSADMVDESGNSLYTDEEQAENQKKMDAWDNWNNWTDTSAANKKITTGHTATAYYNFAGSTLSSASTAVTSLSNKVASGDLISSPQLKSDGSFDWSSMYSSYTTIWNNFSDQVSSATKTLNYTTEKAATLMQSYVAKAKAQSGALKIESYESVKDEALKTSLQKSFDTSWDIFGIAWDELTIKKASSDMLSGVESGEI